MANTCTNESCMMQLCGWVGRGGRVAYAPPPHLHPSYWHLNIALSLIFIKIYVEANSYQMSCINHNNKQDTDIIFHFGQNL